jgi:hypothetical protein
VFTHRKKLSLYIINFKGACNKRLFILDAGINQNALFLALTAQVLTGIVGFPYVLKIHTVAFSLPP